MEFAVVALLGAATGAAAALTLIGFFARTGWPWELACHFRAQYAAVLVACGAAWALLGHGWLAAAAGACALANLIGMRPLAKSARGASGGKPLRILISNLWFINADRRRIFDLIAREQPDVVVAIEVTDEWLAAFAALERQYPFSRSALYLGSFGIALYSRLPLRSVDVVHVGQAGLPSIVAHVAAGPSWTIIATHPFSPKTALRARLRDHQLLELAQLIRRQPGPVVVAGDFNATPWSPIFRDLIRITGLRDSRLGFGLHASWPARWPFARIPIDHCLVSEEVAVTRRTVGPAVGSDHFPVIVECAVRA